MLNYFFKIKQKNFDLVLLLIIGGFYSLGMFLSNTFVNIYLWRQSHDLMIISIYNISIYIFQLITFILAGRIAKNIDRIVVLRMGVIILSLFFLTVLILGTSAAKYYILLGSILGVGYGFYWLAFNVLTFEITEPETRDFFNGFMGSLQSFGGMIGPFIAGVIIANMITNKGYMTIFSMSLLLFLLAVLCSFFLKRRKADGKYELLFIIKRLSIDQNWKYTIISNTFQGMREGIFSFVVTIWIFLITNNEFTIGVFNLVFFGISFLFYFIISKGLLPLLREQAIFIGVVLISLSAYVLVINAAYTNVLIYAAIIGIAYPLLNVPFNSLTYDVIGQSYEAKRCRIEYIVALEVFVNIGRIISVFSMIIFLSLYTSQQVVPIFLVIFSHAYLFIHFFTQKITIKS